MTAVLRSWTGNYGRVVLTLHADGRLVKSEKSCDRLHVLGDRGHAADCSMVAEALSLGAKTLEIREDGGAYVWCAEIEPLIGTRVFLKLHVRVAKEWQRDPKQLGRLGF